MPLTIPGVDYSFSRPNVAALKSSGTKFAMRYLSPPPNSKNLTVAEKNALFDHGISIGLVWESGAGRAKAGRNAGASDARTADAQVRALGLNGIPVYFAVDFDATDADKPHILAYLQGAASVISHDRVGVYGSYYVVKYMHDHDACKWFWQTYAWSGGQVHPATHIHQYRNGVTLGSGQVDLNHASPAGMGSMHNGNVPPPPPMPPQPAHPDSKIKAWRERLRHVQALLRQKALPKGLRYVLQGYARKLRSLIRGAK